MLELTKNVTFLWLGETLNHKGGRDHKAKPGIRWLSTSLVVVELEAEAEAESESKELDFVEKERKRERAVRQRYVFSKKRLIRAVP